MSGVQDCREETVNNLVMWAVRHGIEASEINFEKQLIKKETEECWKTLMEHASERCLEREFVYGEFLENLYRLARENF